MTSKLPPLISGVIYLVDSILTHCLTTQWFSHFNSWMASLLSLQHGTVHQAQLSWEQESLCIKHMQMKVEKKINLSEARGRWRETEHSNGGLNMQKCWIFRLSLASFFQTGTSGKTLQSGSLERVMMNAGCIYAAFSNSPGEKTQVPKP